MVRLRGGGEQEVKVLFLLVLALACLMVSDDLRAEPPQDTTTRLGKVANKPLV